MSDDWRFAIAYNAALQAATAALAAAGYRASRENHHYRVIQSLELTLGKDAKFIRAFDAFRKKRNVSSYGGTPVFRGTRVPLQLLLDSLERGHTLEEFLEGYPTVSREMAVAVLEEAQQLLSAQA